MHAQASYDFCLGRRTLSHAFKIRPAWPQQQTGQIAYDSPGEMSNASLYRFAIYIIYLAGEKLNEKEQDGEKKT